jgi:hypothetical protein
MTSLLDTTRLQVSSWVDVVDHANAILFSQKYLHNKYNIHTIPL